MSNTTEDITALIPGLPSIVVTEATPLSTTSTTVAVGASAMNVEAGKTTTASSGAHGMTAEHSITSESGKESTGEFQPVGDCSQCVVSLNVNPQDNTLDTNDETDSSENQELSTEETSSVRRTWCQSYGGVWGIYSHVSETLVDSVYLVPFQLILLAFPIAAAFMGARYIDECPMSSVSPFLLFVMGIAGTILIMCRILQIAKKSILPTSTDWWWTRVVILFSGLILTMCMCLEATAFFRSSPSFNPTDPNYCSKIFYDFTYWSNFAVLIIFIVVFLLYYPTCTIEMPTTDRAA